MSKYNYHRDCIHYDNVSKESRPYKEYKETIYAYCPTCGYGFFYNCESDFEDVKTDCKHFEPKQIDKEYGGPYEVCEAISKAYNKGREDAIDEFIAFAKKEFGVTVNVHESDSPDSFETIFGDLVRKGRDDAIEAFVSACEDAYPKNWANEFELGGRTNHFSLNDIHRLAEQIKEKSDD